MTCEVDGCDRPRIARGLCNLHYCRLLKQGTPGDASPKKARDGDGLKFLEEHLGHAEDGCLPFPFKTPDGHYPRVTYRGQRKIASRIMCELAHGAPPTPKHEAAHNCGKGLLGCVNPRHLRWATHTENMSDRIEHGTANRGERHGMARLTSGDVAEIRRMLADGFVQTSIANRFGIGQATVSHIARGSSWGWLP